MKTHSYFLALMAVLCAFSFVHAGEPAGGAVYIQSGPVEEKEVIWVDPGWYYGIWFGDEMEYHNYCRHHRHVRHNHQQRLPRGHHRAPHNAQHGRHH